MRAVIQRVSRADVRIEGRVTGSIGLGLLVFLGVEKGDGENDLEYVCSKTAGLRIFGDDESKMNLSVAQAGGSILLVSQFTLCGDARKGRRPSFSAAAEPDAAQRLYNLCAQRLRQMGLRVETGQFQAHMDVSLNNDGPVTILLDSKKQF